MEEERTRRLRRRIAGLVLLVGLLVVGSRLLSLHGRVVTIEIRYLLGDPPAARALEAAIVGARGEVVAAYRVAEARPILRQRVPLAPGTYRVEITLVGGSAGTRSLARTVEVHRGADVTVDLRGQ